jgi:hypothetical protein
LNQGVKIGIGVGGLAAAIGIFVFFGGSEEAQLAKPESMTLWMCAACGVTSDLTVKQAETLARESGPPAPPLNCAKCKEKKVYRAGRCDKCQTPFFGSDVPDSSGQCPKCNPEAKPPSPLPDEIEEPLTEEEKADQPEGAPIKKKPRPKAA